MSASVTLRKPKSIRIHKILWKTRANGPGVRVGIWVQGCSLQCLGCFNPETHDPREGTDIEISMIVKQLIQLEHVTNLEGVTISGGEPFDQPYALLELVTQIREQTECSLIIFTGYTVVELNKMLLFSLITGLIDLLITGRFIRELRVPTGLKGSSNQEYVFCSTRYTEADLIDLPVAELSIQNGEIIISGIHPELFKEAIRHEFEER